MADRIRSNLQKPTTWGLMKWLRHIQDSSWKSKSRWAENLNSCDAEGRQFNSVFSWLRATYCSIVAATGVMLAKYSIIGKGAVN